MALTLVRGETQIMPGSVDLTRLFDPFLTATEGNWDITNGGNDYTITGVRDPSAAQDAATKAYVDSLTTGLFWTGPARVCGVDDLDIATELEDGDALDGVTLATGDRVLLTGQTTPAILNTVHQFEFSVGTPTGGTWDLTLHLDGLAPITIASIARDTLDYTLQAAIDVACTSAAVPGWTNGDITVGGGTSTRNLVLSYDGASVAGVSHAVPTGDLSGLTGGSGAPYNLVTQTLTDGGNAVGPVNEIHFVSVYAGGGGSGWSNGGTWDLTLNLEGLAPIDITIPYSAETTLEGYLDAACDGVVPGWTNGDITTYGRIYWGAVVLDFQGASVIGKNHGSSAVDGTSLTGSGAPFSQTVNLTSNDGSVGIIPDEENGVYIVQASGTALRADDWAAATSAANYALFVEEGTCGDKAYTVTNDAPSDVIDTDNLVFGQFAGDGQVAPAHVYGDAPTVTDGVAFVTLTTTPMTGGTERVYLNGVLQVAGGSNDYTLVDSTGVITFNFNLVNAPGQLDVVVVDYDN